MSRRPHRASAFAAGALALSMMLAACGSGGSDTGTGSSDGGGSSNGGAGIEEAKAEVAKYAEATAFEVEPLPSKPPAGKVVAQVNCTLPTCGRGNMEAPVEALDWTLNLFEYDIAKGPQDFVRAFNQALESKPDYISVTMVFPEDIVSDQLERAVAEGIPVVDQGGQELAPGVSVLTQGPGVMAAAGAIAADAALADAGGPVNAVIPVDPALPLHTHIADGALDELERLSPDSKGELLELSLAQPAATNVSGIVNYLKRNPDTQYIVFPGTTLYAGVQQGLQAAGLLDTVKLIGTFPFPSDIQSIENGEFIASVAGEATFQWRNIDNLARLSVGEQITDKEPLSSFRILTSDNVTPESIDPPGYQEAYKSAWGV